MNNYRNNMPHYDSMPHDYNPMGINDFKTSNNKMKSANTMPGMPEDMLQRPFIPETEMPLEIDGDMPALPPMPENQMPGVTQPGMPQTQMPMMPGMPQTQMPMMPGMPQTQLPGMPPLDGNRYPVMPENGVPPVTCEQMRELMRWMNCPINGNNANGPRPLVPPENGLVPPVDEDI